MVLLAGPDLELGLCDCYVVYNHYHLRTFLDKYEHSPNARKEEEPRSVCGTD